MFIKSFHTFPNQLLCRRIIIQGNITIRCKILQKGKILLSRRHVLIIERYVLLTYVKAIFCLSAFIGFEMLSLNFSLFVYIFCFYRILINVLKMLP